jgi:hypothetical protein
MAITQPVWSRVDEAQHADFIIQLSHGVFPAADATVVDPETLRVMAATNVFRFDTPGAYPAPDLTDIGPPPAGMSVRANAAWMSRHLWQLSFESAQTPGYYLAMVPVWWAADKLGGTLAAVYVMRIVNALLIALLAPMAFVVATRLSPGRTEVAVLAALFAALLPGLALNGTRVSNDGLAAVLGGLTIVLAVRSAGQVWTWRRTVMVGLVLGAGFLVKLTLIGLLPALALAIMWPARDRSWPRRFVQAGTAAAVAVACLLLWFVINTHVYGVYVPSARTNRLSGMLPMPFQPAFVGFELAFFVISYWSGEPLGELPLAAPFVALSCLLSLIAVAGLVKLLRPLAIPAGPLVVAAAAVCGMAAASLLLPATAGFEFAGPGRYVYTALPAGAALFGLGIYAALARGFARRTLSGVYAAAAIGIVVAAALWPAPDPVPGPGAPPSDATLIDATGSGALQGVTITVDRIALDPARSATWFEVTITNSGPGEVEWSVTPISSTGGGTAHGDYMHSTHMPGDVDAGHSATGWLLMPMDPAKVRGAGIVRLRFPDVALDGYAVVEDVVVDVKVASAQA